MTGVQTCALPISIRAGANAITYTPPTNGSLFAESMRRYRSTYAPDQGEP